LVGCRGDVQAAVGSVVSVASSGGSLTWIWRVFWSWGWDVWRVCELTFLCASWCWDETESLILAQNERWRRA
jgi:hypothetical protein